MTDTSATTTRTDVVYDGQVLGVRIGDQVFEHCARCYGTGHYSYNPLDGTRCYGCNGRGFGAETTEADLIRRYENRQKAATRRAARADREATRKLAAMDQWRAEHRELVDALAAFLTADDAAPRDRFLAQLAEQVHHSVRPLSERQLAAVAPAIEKVTAREAQRAAEQATQAQAGHLGTVGEKVTADVEITRTRVIDSCYNGRPVSKVLVTMRDDAGHTLKTWSNGAFGWDAKEGQRVTITGTVKEHGSYQGLPETTLVRVKVA